MNNKFAMTFEENVAYAKRNIVDLLYKTARLEGIAVTFPETNELYEGRNVASLSVDDVVKINNLKKTWQFVFETIDYPLDLRYIKQLNQLIQSNLHPLSGVLRTTDVTIGGTTWKPDTPDESKVVDDLHSIAKIECITERAITLMLYIMRSQLFYDGNKRTAQLVANQVMIQNGCGIIAIPVEKQGDFVKELVDYYESNKMDKIKQFIYDFAIDGYNRDLSQTAATSKFDKKQNFLSR